MSKIAMLSCDGDVTENYITPRVSKECHYLLAQGHLLELFTLGRDNGKPDAKLTVEGIPLTVIQSQNILTRFLYQIIPANFSRICHPLLLLSFTLKAKKYIRNKEFTHIHAQNLYSTFSGWIIKKNEKIVFDMREFIGMQAERKYASFFKIKLRNFLIRSSSAVLYVHPQQKEEAPKSLQEKFYYLPNYPDAHTIFPMEKTACRELRISYIGHLRPLQEPYFRVLATVCEKIGGIHLYIHGSGAGFEKISALEKSFPKTVTTTGHYDGNKDTVKLFSECDLLYCAYDISVENWKRAEATKFFEAIATETPMIVSSGSYMESTVLKYDIGFSVDASNDIQLFSLLSDISNSDTMLLEKGENISKIKHLFQWQNVVAVLKSIYQ